MAVNQRQIAEKLGVSIALVSRVLSGKAAEIGISKDKIEAVLRTADELGYVPSAAALSLIGKSTRTIGIAVYDFNDPFFSTLIKEIQSQAHEHDYSLILAGFLNRNPDRQDLQALHKHSLDSLIVIGTDEQAQWLEDFTDIPAVRIGHGAKTEKSIQIGIDETDAAGKLISHLLEMGRKEIAFIQANLPAHRIRSESFQLAAKEMGIPLQMISSKELDAFQAGMDATGVILSNASGTDAIVCATDRVAMGALHALHDARMSVPGDISVTGFDDIPAASEFIPSITTIRQPVKRMVQEVFSVMLNPANTVEISLKGELLVRKSS